MKSCLDISRPHHIAAPWYHSKDHKQAQAADLDFFTSPYTNSSVPHKGWAALAWNQHSHPRAGQTIAFCSSNNVQWASTGLGSLSRKTHSHPTPAAWYGQIMETILNPDSADRTPLCLLDMVCIAAQISRGLWTPTGQAGPVEPLWSSQPLKCLQIIACASVERTGTDLLSVVMTS